METEKSEDLCPHCKADLQGRPIPEEHRENFGGLTHFSRRQLIKPADVYKCPDCGGEWTMDGRPLSRRDLPQRAM